MTVCMYVCMRFIYFCTLPSGMQGPRLGGWNSAVSPLSLPGQMAPVTERGGGAVEGGELSAAPEWPVPRATTSGDHLQLAHPTPSVLVPLPLVRTCVPISLFQMGEVATVCFNRL